MSQFSKMEFFFAFIVFINAIKYDSAENGGIISKFKLQFYTS